MKLRNRQLGQGMTEYIIIVGLIAILLVAAVRRFSTVLDVTIQGSTGQVNGISNRIHAGPGGGGGGPAPGTVVTSLPPGSTITGTTATAPNGDVYLQVPSGGWVKQ